VPRGYPRSWLRGDLVAGVTVSAYLIPQVMAYAVVAGLPPVAGLWAILPALVIYAVLGSSPTLSVGPESTTALMTAVAIGPLAAGHTARYAALAAALAILVGLFALVAWVARLGFVADLLSRPVLIGYLTGVAVIMVAGQLGKITGVPVHGRTFIAEIISFARGVVHVRAGSLVVAVLVLVFLFLVQSRWRQVPGPLLAVLLATLAVAVFRLDRHGIAVIGTIPVGLPTPGLPSLHPDDLRILLFPGLSVLLVAFSDDVLTARSFARPADRAIDANRELLALGMSNIGAGLCRGFPVSSSASRTAIGRSAGSRTQVYSLAALAAVIGVLLVLRPVLARFPSAALGAIVVYAAVLLVDARAFRRLAAFRRSEFLLAVAACAGVLAFNILYGVLLAIAISVGDMLVRVARPHDAILGRVPGVGGMHDIDDYPAARTIPGLVVYRYDAPLFFANSEDFKRRALAAADQQVQPVAWFILNVEANVEVDITGLDALDAVRENLAQRGTVFALARVKQDVLRDLEAFGLAEKIGAQYMFPTLPLAVAAYEKWAKAHPPQPPPAEPAGPEPARPEPPGPEQPRPEQPRPEQPRPEQPGKPRPEQPGPDEL